MSAILRWLGLERRSAVRTSDPFIADFFGAAPGSHAPEGVLSSMAVAARCVGLRSELLSSVPLRLYRREADGGRRIADDHPLYGVLHDDFNANLTAFEGREFLIRSLDMRGNAYARLEINSRGQVAAIHPISPLSVGVELMPSGRLRYRVSERGGSYVLTQDDMLHIRGPSKDGHMGMSPLQIASGSVTMAMEYAKLASTYLTNGMRPGGVLTYENKLGEKADDLRARMESKAGTSQAGRILIFDNGGKFTPITWTPEDAELLASRKLSNEDIARVFGLPPTSVGITDKATYSNTEQEARALVQNALGPLAARIESALQRCLLTPQSRRTYYIEHDLEGLLRGDVEARYKAYKFAREIGVLSANDIRKRENEPPIPGGDERYVPMNWMKLGQSGLDAKTASQTPPQEEEA